MEIVFILYSVQHMSYLYHKHHIFNIFVYNSMSTFSLRSCALKICSPIMSLFLPSFSSFHFKTNPIMFPFSHTSAQFELVERICSLPSSLKIGSKRHFDYSPRLFFHQQHLSQSLSPLHVSTFTCNIFVLKSLLVFSFTKNVF